MTEFTSLSLAEARDGLKKKSFSARELTAAHVSAIEKARPPTAKGVYIKKITISGAMTPGVEIKHVAEVVA